MSALVAHDAMRHHGLDARVVEGTGALARARTFHTLDALRGLAALTVVAFHAAFFYAIKAPAEGQIAVDLFFVMSGFIIAYRYDRDLQAGMGLTSFIIVRLVRLYPLYFLGAVLGVLPAVVAVLGGDADWFHKGLVASFPFHVLMLPSRFVVPRIEELYPFNYVAWSLALEMLINVAYAATFRVWTIRRLVILVGTAFVGLCICDAHYGSLSGGFAWPNAPVGFARVVYGFPMGVLMYRLFARKPFAVTVPWWSLLLLAGAMLLFDPPWSKVLWELLLVSTVVPLIVMAAVVNEPPRGARGPCALAGLFSYVVYSLHAPFIGLFLRGEDRMHLDVQTTSLAKAVSFTLLLGLLCIVAHFAYDKPVRRWLSRRWIGTSDRSVGGTAIAVKN